MRLSPEIGATVAFRGRAPVRSSAITKKFVRKLRLVFGIERILDVPKRAKMELALFYATYALSVELLSTAKRWRHRLLPRTHARTYS